MFRLVLLLSLAAYVLAMCMPVYEEKDGLFGFMAVLGGWLVFLNDLPSAVSWLGNIFFIFALIFILRRKKPKPGVAMVFAILATACGLAALGAGQIKLGFGESETLAKATLTNAFYVWIASFVLMALAAFLKKKHLAAKNAPAEQPAPVQ